MYNAYKSFKRGYWQGRSGSFAPDKQWRSKYSKTKRLANRIKRLEKGQSGKEWKYFDTAVNADSSTGGTVQCLNLVAEGDDITDREGRSINLQTIYMKMNYRTNTTTDFDYTFRTMLILDTQNNSANPAIGDILDTVSVTSLRELATESRSRFRILYDKVTIVNTQYTGVKAGRYREYFKKFKKPKKLDFINTTGVIGSVTGKALFLVVFGNTGANHADANIKVRIRYTD